MAYNVRKGRERVRESESDTPKHIEAATQKAKFE